MDQADCLQRWRAAGAQRQALLLPQGTFGLHTMLGSCGYGHERDAGYDWSGTDRGPVSFALIQYTLAGRGWLRYERHEHVVQPGMAMILHMPHNHRYRCQDGVDWEHAWLCINGAEALRLLRLVEGRCGGVLSLPPESAAVGELLALVDDGLAGRLEDPFTCSARTYQLLMRLLEMVHGSGALPPPVVRACAFARKHLADPIGVDEMAEAAGLSRYHFSRLFREQLGRSPGDWLIAERLSVAARLLTGEPDTALATIAERCGFQNANYFGKAFRRAMGVAPGAFRRSGLF